MDDLLTKARLLSERVRFSGEKIRFTEANIQSNNKEIDEFFSTSSLPITSELTPGLYSLLSEVCDKLTLPADCVKAYVYASPNLQAECYSADDKECILRFSSGLIHLLDENELKFVIGHELGHFLFKHGLIRKSIQNQSREYFMQQRSQEISVDRIGYLAVGSLDMALKAMIKTISGLSSDYLRYDISNYLSHLEAPSQRVFDTNQLLTHPSVLLRCRALLWFSMKVNRIEDLRTISQSSVEKLDEKVIGDLAKYMDGPSLKLIGETKQELQMWLFMDQIVKEKSFNKKAQHSFGILFGEEKLIKMKTLLRNNTVKDNQIIVDDKLDLSKSNLRALIPYSFEKVLKEIENKIY